MAWHGIPNLSKNRVNSCEALKSTSFSRQTQTQGKQTQTCTVLLCVQYGINYNLLKASVGLAYQTRAKAAPKAPENPNPGKGSMQTCCTVHIAHVHNMALIKTCPSSRPCVWREPVLFGLSLLSHCHRHFCWWQLHQFLTLKMKAHVYDKYISMLRRCFKVSELVLVD